MPVMSRPIQPLSALAMAGALIVDGANAIPFRDPDPPSTVDSRARPTVYESIPYRDPDPPSTVDSRARPTAFQSIPFRDPDPPSTVDSRARPTVSSSIQFRDPDPPSTVDRTTKPPSTSSEAPEADSTTGGTTITIDEKPQPTTGTDPEPCEDGIKDPKPTTDGKGGGGGTRGGLGGEPDVSSDYQRLATVAPEEATTSPATSTEDKSTPPMETVTGTGPPQPIISKPVGTLSYRGSVTTSVLPPASTTRERRGENITSGDSTRVQDRYSATTGPYPSTRSKNRGDNITSGESIRVQDRYIATVSSPAATPEVTTKDFAPTSDSPVTSRAIPAHLMNTLQGESAYPPVISDESTTVQDVPSSTLGDSPDFTREVSNINPLVEGPKSQEAVFTSDHSPAIFPTPWTPTRGTGKPDINRQPTATVSSGITRASPLSEPSSTMPKQLMTTTAEKPSDAATPAGTPASSPVSIGVTSNQPPYGNQAAPAATTLGALSRGLSDVPLNDASATHAGPPPSSSGVFSGIFRSGNGASSAATTQVTTDDGSFRAQATDDRPTSDVRPISEVKLTVAKTPVTDRATEYGTSTLTKGQRPSSDLTVRYEQTSTPSLETPASTIAEVSTTSSKPVTLLGPNYGGPPAATISDPPTTMGPQGTFILERAGKTGEGSQPDTDHWKSPRSTTCDTPKGTLTATSTDTDLPSHTSIRPKLTPNVSATTSTSSGVTIVGVPELTTGPITTSDQPLWTLPVTSGAEDTTTNGQITAAETPMPTFPAILPILHGWTCTAENGSTKTILPTTSDNSNGVLPSLSPGHTTSTGCISSTMHYHENSSILETLTLSTSTNTDNKPVNMFPTVGPVAVVSMMDVGVGVEPAALGMGSGLGSYERACSGGGCGVIESYAQSSMLKLGVQTALWGIILSSLISKGGRRYAREAVLTVVSVLLVLLQSMSGVKAADFADANMNTGAQPIFDSETSFSDGAVFGGLGGFTFALVLIVAAGAFYIKKGVDQKRATAGWGADTQEWARYEGGKERMKRREERRAREKGDGGVEE